VSEKLSQITTICSDTPIYMGDADKFVIF